MDAQLQVILAHSDIVIAAGDAGPLTLHLRNRTAQPGAFHFEVEGLPAEWVDLGRAGRSDIRLRPGAETTVELLLRIPADEAPTMLPFVVRAHDREDPTLVGSAFGSISIVAPGATQPAEPNARPATDPRPSATTEPGVVAPTGPDTLTAPPPEEPPTAP